MMRCLLQRLSPYNRRNKEARYQLLSPNVDAFLGVGD